ncbi:GntR family transcriptional regulator [Subtercola endophyticus]|uniref:GntR family transcriptional regulator n=1 Tax=Subtercola endophyticus TaxID=2895559 RepID=UPI001E3D13FF|nr:GntR family transcriptional regulator [Subtercola endophyticus]UFS58604.1 GntR family transcriptional regulator [Subtercola endophyticus]
METRTGEIVTRIRREIRRLELHPGERLGSERELAERLNEPRSALRAALEVMEADDEIRRAMGSQGGIFVSDGRIERNLNTIVGVPGMLRQQGFRCTTTVLRAMVGLAAPDEQRALRLSESSNVIRLVRRRDANDIPWSLDTAVIPADLVPGLLQHDLTESLYDVLRDDYGLETAEAHETIDLAAAASYAASVLDIEIGTPVFQIWRTTTATNGAVMEFAHDLFRSDRTRIQMQRLGARWKRATRS